MKSTFMSAVNSLYPKEKNTKQMINDVFGKL